MCSQDPLKIVTDIGSLSHSTLKNPLGSAEAILHDIGSVAILRPNVSWHNPNFGLKNS